MNQIDMFESSLASASSSPRVVSSAASPLNSHLRSAKTEGCWNDMVSLLAFKHMVQEYLQSQRLLGADAEDIAYTRAAIRSLSGRLLELAVETDNPLVLSVRQNGIWDDPIALVAYLEELQAQAEMANSQNEGHDEVAEAVVALKVRKVDLYRSFH